MVFCFSNSIFSHHYHSIFITTIYQVMQIIKSDYIFVNGDEDLNIECLKIVKIIRYRYNRKQIPRKTVH